MLVVVVWHKSQSGINADNLVLDPTSPVPECCVCNRPRDHVDHFA